MKTKEKLDKGKSLPRHFIHSVINESKAKFKIDKDV